MSSWYVDWLVDWLMIDWLVGLEQGLTTWTRQAWNSYRFTCLWLPSIRIKGMPHHASTMGIYFFICHLWYFYNHRATFSSFMGKNIFGFSSNTDSYTFCLLSSSPTEEPWVLKRLSCLLAASSFSYVGPRGCCSPQSNLPIHRFSSVMSDWVNSIYWSFIYESKMIIYTCWSSWSFLHPVFLFHFYLSSISLLLFFPLTLWGFSTFTFEAMAFCCLFLIASGDSTCLLLITLVFMHSLSLATIFLTNGFELERLPWVAGVLGGLARDCPQDTLEFATPSETTKKSVLKIPTSEAKTHSNQIWSTKPDYSVPPLAGTIWDLFPCHGVLQTGPPLGLVTSALSCQLRVGKTFTGQAVRSGNILLKGFGLFLRKGRQQGNASEYYISTNRMQVSKDRPGLSKGTLHPFISQWVKY